MQHLIASYLSQKKECSLPLLGKVAITINPASVDEGNLMLNPPARKLHYDQKDDYLTDEFVDYVAEMENVSHVVAEERINNWCLTAKMKLDEGEKIQITSMGTLQKSGSGQIFMQGKNGLPLYQPVGVHKVIHESDEHAVLVGDKERTTTQMNAYFATTTKEKSRNKFYIWPLLLAGICLIFLFFYFSSFSFTTSGIGDKQHVSIRESPVQYTVIHLSN
jgi:hypothetical protein